MAGHAADDGLAPNPPETGRLADGHASDDAATLPPDRKVLGALFGAIALVMGADVVLDGLEGAGFGHVALEALVLVMALAGVGWLMAQFVRERRRTLLLRTDLLAARSDAARWRRESESLVKGLGAAIDTQFQAWGFSPAEREVALLLLKGLALKDVAQVRGTSERTVRQQALSLYKKANLAGRAELSAFFLEDLLMPVK